MERRSLAGARRSLMLVGVFTAHLIVPDTSRGQASPAEPERLEEVVVSSTALDQTLHESAQPVSVLEGDELAVKAKSSLGETLASEPGVAASGFGPGASRPVIRGLGGDRIRILENGIGTQDVSAASPDHAVTIEPSLVNKIEVVRGPAALLYGTSAVGGIVNVFDNRIPELLPEGGFSGTAQVRGGTVDKERTGVVSLDSGAGSFAFHLDAFARKTDDIDIPGFARTEDLRERMPLDRPEPRGTLPSSFTESDSVTFGTSYVRESGFIGAAVSEFNTNYGVPNGEENISIDARRRRLDLRGKLFEPSAEIKSMDLKVGLVDYEHTEFEGEEAGTRFENRGLDARYEIVHEAIGSWEGLLGLQAQHADFSAIGEEAFQPPTETTVLSGFVFEHVPLTDSVELQLGGRFDYHGVEADADRDEGGASRSFPTFSQSGGLVWNMDRDYALAFSVAHTERAPTGQELFANGPHIATAAFEVGDADIDPERSWGYDLTLRKRGGTVTGSVGAFYNRFSNYIGLDPTGEIRDELAVYEFNAQRADFYGFESRLDYYLLGEESAPERLSIDVQPDYVRAENRDTGEPIPRVPPFRLKSGISYARDGLGSARLEVQQIFRQSRNATFETETDPYTFLNVSATRPMSIFDVPAELFVRGQNLLNEKARDHTSFIKDVAPLPGANVVAGVSVRF